MNSIRLARAIAKGAIGLQSPIYVQFAVTRRCNMGCRMCNSNASRAGESELELPQIERLADVLAELGVGVVILTGGEPFMRPDLEGVFEAFAARGITPRLQTNGVLATEARLKRLVDAGLREATLSLDSLDEQREDDLRGRPGSWRQMIEALAMFSRTLPRRGNMSGVNVVASKVNVDEVPRMVRFIDAIGFYASIIPVHVSRSAKQEFIIRKRADELAFGEDDFDRVDNLYAELIAMKRAGVRIQNSVRFLSECPEFLKRGRTKWRCDSPRLFFSISPSGSFLPCVDVPYERSMLDDSFLADYRSGKIARDLAERVAACPGCMYACWPEVEYACSHLPTLWGRGMQAAKLLRDERPELSAEQMFELAATI